MTQALTRRSLDVASPAANLLELHDLVTEFHGRQGSIRANDGVNLAVPRGITLGIVGESGSGKSVLCRSILRLLPPNARLTVSGAILYEGRDLLRLTEEEMRKLRGTEIGMVFQNPMTSLNPVWPIGDQVDRRAARPSAASARERRAPAASSCSHRVGISSPERRVDEYPHQWSGGMLQRAVIAMAMAGEPQPAPRRRADHGARRHHPGPDPGAAAASCRSGPA